MNVRLVAVSEIGSYIGVNAEGSYFVLTLDDSRELQLGDVLSGTFDGQGSLFYSVRNLTRQEHVRICLENWDCPVAGAIDSLLALMRSRPGSIYAGSQRFVSDAEGVADQLREEILRS